MHAKKNIFGFYKLGCLDHINYRKKNNYCHHVDHFLFMNFSLSLCLTLGQLFVFLDSLVYQCSSDVYPLRINCPLFSYCAAGLYSNSFWNQLELLVFWNIFLKIVWPCWSSGRFWILLKCYHRLKWHSWNAQSELRAGES